MTDFIDLDRRFLPLTGNVSPEDSALLSYTELLEFGYVYSWEKLLKRRLVIILAEAGSGKTWELKHQVDILTSQNKIAFFVPLERLISTSFEAIIQQEDHELLRRWQDGTDEAYFFLDSVDEAKFRRPGDFFAALDNLRAAIGAKRLSRARIVISSRISEWQPSTDMFEVTKRFNSEEATTSTRQETDSDRDKPILVVQLIPLDEDRVRTFVEAKGLTNSAEFLEALSASFAWEFARRPIDVEDLISYWQSYRRLGCLTELLEHSITKNLERSTRDTNDPLSAAQARQGAECLAASTMLCRQFGFNVPDNGHDAGLNPVACLPADWTADKIRALIQRPLFDSESYGKIRFHHRRVAEYLAARWIDGLMRKGCPLEHIEDLLFEKVGNKNVIRESLAPVTAWLSSGSEPWNESIRNLVLTSAPEILLVYGDPACLSVVYRKKILEAIVGKFKGRKRIWLPVSSDALSRIADSSFSEYVSKIIKDRKLPSDLREIMVRIVRFGNLRRCFGDLLDIISSKVESEDMKFYAIAAIRDAGDIETRRKLAEYVLTLQELSISLSPLICEAIYPSVINASQLIKILEITEPPQLDYTELGYRFSRRFQSVLQPENAAEMLQFLLTLATSSPHVSLGNIETQVSVQFIWLWEVIPNVIETLLRKVRLTTEQIEIVANALRLLGHSTSVKHFHEDKLGELNAVTLKQPSVRRSYFWKVVERWRVNYKMGPYYYGLPWDHRQVIDQNDQDFVWLVEDINEQTSLQNREFSVKCAVDLWFRRGRLHDDLRKIRSAIAGDHQLLVIYKKAKSQWRFLRLKRMWGWLKRTALTEWWWQRRWSIIRERTRHQRDRLYLLQHLKHLKSAKDIHALAVLCREACSNMLQLTPNAWDGVIKKRGNLIVHAAQKGCKLAWRNYEPPLPYENRINFDSLVVGLAGIQIEVDKGTLDFLRCTEGEIDKLVRYAVNELNEFPQWFFTLYANAPHLVEKTLLQCLKGEWQFPSERTDAYGVLYRLIWQADQFSRFLQNSFLELIKTADPPNAMILDRVLRFLTRTLENSRNDLAQIASTRIVTYPRDSKAFNLWLKAWLELDCLACIHFMEPLVGASSDQVATMTTFLASLIERPHEQLTISDRYDYFSTASLRELIPFVYRYIRTQDDVKHRGGVFTPGPRDDAEHFRGMLFGRLANNSSKEAHHALQALLDERVMQPDHDYILHILEQRQERDANLPPWMPADIRSFADQLEIDPRSDHDLFKIVNDRLLDIKHHVERADTSIRQDLHKDDDEIRLRKWFANQLKTRASNKYKVTEEEEIDQRQRPDLRIENSNVVGPISIEIKWADKWTFAELKERMKNQLVGQYLRDANAHFGSYLLCNIGRKKSWIDTKTNKRYGFKEVVDKLQREADKIASKLKDIYSIKVVGIDFTPP